MATIVSDRPNSPGAIAAEAAADAMAIKRRTLTLAILTLTYFFSYMDRQILAILQELIKADLRLSDTQLGLLSGFAFALFYATLGIPIARLADRTRRKNIIACALALWSLMTALCGIAQNFVQLLLFRIGVGVGEAGSTPPSHSIIADLYPPERRAGAMAIYTLGVTLGASAGTTIGGTVAYFYGWRVAMFAVGLPGVLLAVIVWAFVYEPRRGLSDAALIVDQRPMPSLGDGFASMWSNPAARHLVMAMTVTSMIGYGQGAWGPSFMQRSLGIGITDISWYIAPTAAVLGVTSGVVGGRIADRLARSRGLFAQSHLVAIAKTIALPFSFGYYFIDVPAVAVGCLFVATLFASTYLGPTYALIQGLAPLRMRALWSAVTLLVVNLIGLGLGPTLAGMISDAVRPFAGDNSLRWSMAVFAIVTPWAIFHYWRAGVCLKRQLGTNAEPARHG